jgi:hypothetical protein
LCYQCSKTPTTCPVEGSEKTKQDTRRRTFNRQLKAAQEKDLIGVREINGTTFVWFEQPNQGGT